MARPKASERLIDWLQGWPARRRRRRTRALAGNAPLPLLYRPPASAVVRPSTDSSRAGNPSATSGTRPSRVAQGPVWIGVSVGLVLALLGTAWHVGGQNADAGAQTPTGDHHSSDAQRISWADDVARAGDARLRATGTLSPPRSSLEVENAGPAYARRQSGHLPKPIKEIDPVYPEAARAAGVEGLVIVTYSVDAHGKPHNLKVTKSIPMLDQAVIAALRQWEYTPPSEGSTGEIYRYNAEFELRGSRR
jgi:TonB family protein